MLTEFDQLVKQRDSLRNWWALGVTRAEYDNKCHTLRVDITKPSLITYCGQQYAGSQNYHDAPSFFAEAVQKEMASEARRITANAYEAEIKRLDTLISKHKEAVLKALGDTSPQEMSV